MYEFREEDAFEFARAVGIKTKARGNNLHFSTCPYCKSKKDKDTFAIDLKTGKFKCLRASCGVSGNMLTLAQDFSEFELPQEYQEYYRPKKKYKNLATPKNPIIPKPKAIEYLVRRGIPEEIAKKYEITVQTERENVLVFPFYDEKGRMQFVKYRKTDFDKEKDSAKEWCEASCKPILFGMKQCSNNFNSLVITEGQMDTLAVATAFDGNIDVASVPTGAKGFTFMPYCWDWLNKFKEIVIFGDYEKGKITLLDEFTRRFPTKVKHVREQDYRDCKDANEILLKYGKSAIKECIEKSEYVPVRRVLSMAEVKKKEVSKFATGFSDMDKLLEGGMPFGCLTVLSGVRGEGKSVIAQQIVTNALEQGCKAFIYSGELLNSNVKEWIDRQIAGSSTSEEYKGEYLRYFIRNSIQQKIESWYEDKLFIYDNSMVYDEDEDLLKTIIEVISKYSVKVILIDNLMTAMDSFESRDDKYEKQSKLTKALARIAQQYEVSIILVAHKRKRGINAVDGASENDEISGSADITNLAGLVLTYGINNNEETKMEYPRLFKCIKNRLTGKTNYKGFPMKYDARSKRVYGDNDDVDYVFKCLKDDNGFSDVEDTPFN